MRDSPYVPTLPRSPQPDAGLPSRAGRRPDADRGRARLLQVLARPLGVIVLGLAAVMAICAAVGLCYELIGAARPGVDDSASALMAASAVGTGLVGGMLWRLGVPMTAESLHRREAAMLVTAIWFAAGLAGGVPFVVGAELSFVDAFFEATSGFTTTGSTVVTDIEGTLSRPILLWRSIIQWLGGMGIVVLFVAVFPSLGVGAKHLFRSEVPGHAAEGLQPRITETALILWRIYLALTVIAGLTYTALGMDPFEAACHAFTTLPSGGFSTRDASIAGFESPAIEWAAAVLMLTGAVNFGLYYPAFVRRDPKVFLRSTEFKALCGIVLAATLTLAIGTLPYHGHDPSTALRRAFFFVASTITTTGYGADAYMQYAPAMVSIMILLMFLGGSSGSTAGGMKISRAVLLLKTAWREARRAVRPQVVHVVRLDRPAIPDTVLLEVSAFFFVFLGVIAAGVVLLGFTDGVPAPTGFGAMLTTVANNGPAPFHLGDDNFASYSAAAKLWFVLAMVMGRLELMTVLALLHRDMWR